MYSSQQPTEVNGIATLHANRGTLFHLGHVGPTQHNCVVYTQLLIPQCHQVNGVVAHQHHATLHIVMTSMSSTVTIRPRECPIVIALKGWVISAMIRPEPLGGNTM